MSLLCAVEQVVKSCKVEQAKLNDRIQVYRDLLKSLTPQPKVSSEETELADDASTDISPCEKEDIGLLERALEKALRVRTGSEHSKKGSKLPGPQKEMGILGVSSMDVTHLSAAHRGSQRTTRSSSKSASLDRKGYRKPALSVCSSLGSRPLASSNPGQTKTTDNRNTLQKHPASSAGAVHQQASRKLQQVVPPSVSPDHITSLLSKNKTVRSNVASGDDLRKAAPVAAPSSNNTVPCSHTNEPGASRLPQQKGLPSEQTAKWKSLRSKQNRLWDKVIALQRNPGPGRSHFMERMRATVFFLFVEESGKKKQFPRNWPFGSPYETRALVDRLIHRGQELTLLCRELLAKQMTETTTELVSTEDKYDSCMSLESLQLTAAELQNFADQVKQEWKAWDQWKPEGGCFCPTGANGVVQRDGITSPLPLTIMYTTEAELQELERLRMRVALLQQEVDLEQALLDTLSPQLSSIVPGPGCPNPSVLRDVYSLLGEGGERFPAIVLDSEPA
ncbi:uncharacterized protein tedc2 isoform X2 [Archocentrus centrarchus]|uniref:uncharacterized protein tedc2 isoform X2 n=1 Tax=Archocentrus centrarchus TaxID=63155 RepID=UPI0011E9FF50|nr:uncharacterized protein LOC115784976 isoform X2 [Archocentrus centrarchus]